MPDRSATSRDEAGLEDHLRDLIAECAAFFKHASSDPCKPLRFNPEINELLLLLGCYAFAPLAGEVNKEVSIFTIWMNRNRPDLFPGTTPLTFPLTDRVEYYEVASREFD